MNIAIIGTGGMAETHAKNFREIKGVKIVACCDIDAKRAANFAARYGIPKSYAHYADLLESEKLDGVSIVSPDSTHAEIAIASLGKGIHTLCEKPMAVTVDESRSMLAAAKKSGLIDMIHYSKRNSRGMVEAKRLIEKGQLGRILHVDASYYQSWLSTKCWGDWAVDPAWLWRLSTKHGAGGALGDIGCHVYDYAQFLAGELSEIFCVIKTFPKGIKGEKVGDYVLDANDSFCSNVRFACGAIGTLQATRWATGHPNREYIGVYGDKGSVEIDFERGLDRLRFCGNTRNEWDDIAAPLAPTLIERFVKAIKTGQRDVCDFANGVKIQERIAESFVSARTGKPVVVGQTLPKQGAK